MALFVVTFAAGLPRHAERLDALESLDALEAEIAGALQPQLERTHLLTHAPALDGERGIIRRDSPPS